MKTRSHLNATSGTANGLSTQIPASATGSYLPTNPNNAAKLKVFGEHKTSIAGTSG